MNEGGLTQALVRYARGIALDGVPGEALMVAKTCVLDWLGCALAGSDEPLVGLLVGEAEREGATPAASVIGRSLRTSARAAAQINGSASHALDYDDTHLVMSGHPSVPVLPCVLALGEEQHRSGADVLGAFIVGVETECRLGAILGLGHYAVGWHSTATIGTFGGTAACSHLLGLSEEEWSHAFGIAGTQAAGLKSVFGSMSKPLQAGRAAANALGAARLAAQGFTSHPAILETAQGFGATHHADLRPDALEAYVGRYLIRDTVFKYHASCYLTHSAIEATLGLVEKRKVLADRVRSVALDVPEGHLGVCNIVEPHTGLEGKFSLRATVAMALLGDDTADPAAFTDERMHRSDLVAMRDKVVVVPSTEVAGTQTRVTIQLDDGSSVSETLDVGSPATDLERQWERLRTKFVRLASPVIGDDEAWALADAVREIEGVDDVADLLRRCRTER